MSNPITTIGVGLSATVNLGAGGPTANVEIGMGLDANGVRYCYIGHCSGVNYDFPPEPSASGSAGVAISWFRRHDDAPGRARFDTLSASIDFVGLISIGGGITRFRSFPTDRDYLPMIGISLGLEIGVGTPTPPGPPVGGSYATGVCATGTHGNYDQQWYPVPGSGHRHNPHRHNPHRHNPHGHRPHRHLPHGHRPHVHAPHGHAPHGHRPHAHGPLWTKDSAKDSEEPAAQEESTESPQEESTEAPKEESTETAATESN